CGDAPFRARRIANRDTAIAGGVGPILQVKIELTEIVARGVKPGLRIYPTLELAGRGQRTAGHELLAQVGDALAEDRAVGHHGPLTVTDDFPAVQVLAVEQRLGVCRTGNGAKE